MRLLPVLALVAAAGCAHVSTPLEGSGGGLGSSRALLTAEILAVTAADLPVRHRYEMATCPTGDGFNCVAAQTCAAGSCTGTAPSGATEGMWLSNVTGWSLAVCAASGQTLSGAGTMQAYDWHPGAAAWTRNPDLDLSVSLSATSCTGAACRCRAWPHRPTAFRQGHRVRYVASGVTVSGGSTLDVLLEGQL